MRFEQLIYFSTIAASGSFSAAAVQLFIAQPSLTESIKKLENELGYDLFLRSKHGVTLTQKSQQILPIVNNILAEMEVIRALGEPATSQESLSGDLIVETIVSFKPAIGTLMGELNQTHPDVVLIVAIQSAYQIIHDVLTGQCDLGILNLSKNQLNDINTTDFILRKMFYRNIHFIVHHTSPLAGKKSISIATAAKQSFSILSDGKNLPIMSYIFNNLPMPKIAFSSSDFNMTLNHIRQFNSIGLLLSTPNSSIYHIPEEFLAIPLREALTIDCYVLYSKNLAFEKQAILWHFLQLLEKYYA